LRTTVPQNQLNKPAGINSSTPLGIKAKASAASAAESGNNAMPVATRAKNTVTANATTARVGKWYGGGRWRRFMAKSPVNAPGRYGSEQHWFDYSAGTQFHLSDKGASAMVAGSFACAYICRGIA